MRLDWKISILAALCLCLTGCIQIEGVHVLHAFGESDSGAYRLSMSSATYALLTSGDDFSNMYRDLKKWSRPVVRRDGDTVHLEDNSGDAQMDNFYDTHTCKEVEDSAGRRYGKCHFAYTLPSDFAKLSGWSIDWRVVVQPGMRIIDSDNQRTRHKDGNDELLWYFDGDKESRGGVDFTVVVPVADR